MFFKISKLIWDATGDFWEVSVVLLMIIGFIVAHELNMSAEVVLVALGLPLNGFLAYLAWKRYEGKNNHSDFEA